MECKEEPLKAATGGATITIQTLSKSASARALHTDRHQWTRGLKKSLFPYIHIDKIFQF